eukprot:SAG31_NODE_1070_length_10071_cov_6.989771_2_plen_67_part_00
MRREGPCEVSVPCGNTNKSLSEREEARVQDRRRHPAGVGNFLGRDESRAKYQDHLSPYMLMYCIAY